MGGERRERGEARLDDCRPPRLQRADHRRHRRRLERHQRVAPLLPHRELADDAEGARHERVHRRRVRRLLTVGRLAVGGRRHLREDGGDAGGAGGAVGEERLAAGGEGGEVEDGGDRVAAHRRRRAVGVVARRDEGEQCAERAVGDERRRRVVGERGVGDGEGGVGDERRRRRRVARGGAERREEGGEAARAHELGAPRRRLRADGEDTRRLLLDLDERRRRRRVVVGACLGADERDGTVEEAAVVERGAQLGIVLEVGTQQQQRRLPPARRLVGGGARDEGEERVGAPAQLDARERVLGELREQPRRLGLEGDDVRRRRGEVQQREQRRDRPRVVHGVPSLGVGRDAAERGARRPRERRPRLVPRLLALRRLQPLGERRHRAVLDEERAPAVGGAERAEDGGGGGGGVGARVERADEERRERGALGHERSALRLRKGAERRERGRRGGGVGRRREVGHERRRLLGGVLGAALFRRHQCANFLVARAGRNYHHDELQHLAPL